MLTKNQIIISSYYINENTPIYYPEAKEGKDFFTDPIPDKIIRYSPNNIIRNSYEGYYNEDTQISIIVFSIGRKLYIRPEMGYIDHFFFMFIEKQFKKLGIKERKMNTPFSNGAIPADKSWIAHYRNIRNSAEEFLNSFLE